MALEPGPNRTVLVGDVRGTGRRLR